MHIRTMRPVPGDDFTNPAFARLPDPCRVLMGGLRLMSDPEWQGEADLSKIRNAAWQAGPEGASWPSLDDVETYLLMLAEAGFVHLYPDPRGSGTELFRITGRRPKVHRQGPPLWDPPPDPEPRENPPFMKSVVEGEGRNVRASESAGEDESAGERAGVSGGAGTSGTTRPPRFRMRVPRFCSEHPGGPPEDEDCRNCGTARLRQEEHKELRQDLVQARKLPPVMRGPAVAAIEQRMRLLEEGAASAMLGGALAPEVPVEFVDEHGRIDHT